MGSALLNAIWVGSFKAPILETEQLQVRILLEANRLNIDDLVSHVSSSANGLTQFMIMPTASKIGFPDNTAWEELAAYTALQTAGTSFIVKRLYVAET